MSCAITYLTTFVVLLVLFDGLRVYGVDPCQGNTTCGNGTTCRKTGDTVEDYKCECKPGYVNMTEDVNQHFICTDEDECIVKSRCSHMEKCVNTYGSFRCECVMGVESKKGECKDIDECAQEDVCGAGKCNNTDGSYMCACEDGHVTQGTPCTDGLSGNKKIVIGGTVGLLALMLILGGLVCFRIRKSRGVRDSTLSSSQHVSHTSVCETNYPSLPADTQIHDQLKKKYTITVQHNSLGDEESPESFYSLSKY